MLQVKATKNTYDSKEDLKDNGFIWNKESKVWEREFASKEEYDAFMEHFLNPTYYGRHAVNKFHSKVVFEVKEIEEEVKAEKTKEVSNTLNNNDMKDLSIYTVLKNQENGTYHIIHKDDIKREYPLHSVIDGTGYTSSDAGDYSLYNRDGSAPWDMCKEGSKIFGESFENLEYDTDESHYGMDNVFTPVNLDEIGLEDKEEEIKSFLTEWEEKNANYSLVDCFTYWDGSNHRTIILKDYQEYADYEYEELNEEAAEPILNAWLNTEEWEESSTGIKRSFSNGFTFFESQWEKDFAIAKAVEGEEN